MATPGTKWPLWVTAGFAMGLGFAWLAFRPGEGSPNSAAAPKAVSSSVPVIPAASRDRTGLADVESLFMGWGGYCVWQGDLTQFAMWNAEEGRHGDFYEVLRSGRRFYFRTLPQADWPLIDHGRLARCGLAFAEPPEARERFYRENPGVVPGQPELFDLPRRPPLLPPVPPSTEGGGLLPDLAPPGAEEGPLVPPWEANERK